MDGEVPSQVQPWLPRRCSKPHLSGQCNPFQDADQLNPETLGLEWLAFHQIYLNQLVLRGQ